MSIGEGREDGGRKNGIEDSAAVTFDLARWVAASDMYEVLRSFGS